jgi:hypothetical protein
MFSKDLRNPMIWLVVVAAVLVSAPAALAGAINWTSGDAGVRDGIGVTFNGGRAGLATADYAAAPLSPALPSVDYTSSSGWTITFSDPVSDLLLYTIWWRGVDGLSTPATFSYTFDASFAILSGETGVTQVGGALQIPNTLWGNGILRFSGPLTSLSVTTDFSDGSYQALTLALGAAPEPSTLTFAGLGGLLLGLAGLRPRR